MHRRIAPSTASVAPSVSDRAEATSLTLARPSSRRRLRPRTEAAKDSRSSCPTWSARDASLSCAWRAFTTDSVAEVLSSLLSSAKPSVTTGGCNAIGNCGVTTGGVLAAALGACDSRSVPKTCVRVDTAVSVPQPALAQLEGAPQLEAAALAGAAGKEVGEPREVETSDSEAAANVEAPLPEHAFLFAPLLSRWYGPVARTPAIDGGVILSATRGGASTACIALDKSAMALASAAIGAGKGAGGVGGVSTALALPGGGPGGAWTPHGGAGAGTGGDSTGAGVSIGKTGRPVICAVWSLSMAGSLVVIGQALSAWPRSAKAVACGPARAAAVAAATVPLAAGVVLPATPSAGGSSRG